MLEKVRKYLNLQRFEEKVAELIEINKQEKLLKSEVDDLAKIFALRESQLNDTSLDPIIKSIMEEKHQAFLIFHIEDIADLRKRARTIEKSKLNLLKDDKVVKAIKEYNIGVKVDGIKKLYRDNQLDFEQCSTLIKGITKKSVKYADAIVFNEKGEFLILQRASQDSNSEKWVIPGGHVDVGEDFETAAKRELQEESGIVIKDVEKVGEYKDSKAHIEYYQGYVDSEEIEIIVDYSEHKDYKWIKVSDLKDAEMIFNMKENLEKILMPWKQKIVTIKKALDGELIGNAQYLELISKVLEKAKQTKAQQAKVAKVMGEFKDGTLKGSDGKVITDRKQAIAISLEMSKAEEDEGEEQVEGEMEGEEASDEEIEKSFLFEKSIYSLVHFLKEGTINESVFLKALDRAHLVKKQVWVNRGGKTFQQTVYVKIGDDKEFEPVKGEQIAPTVEGMDITKYSDKAFLIAGDTYVNLPTLRKIKKEVGVGTFNRALKGWIFPMAAIDKVLGLIWSELKDKGENEKAFAVQNQKNESLNKGDKVDINGTEGEVKEGASDSDGIKYNVELGDGTKLNGVNEKVIDVPAEIDDNKLADTLNNTGAESRAKTIKKIYGIKPIKDIHNYTLEEYLKMHGLDQADINQAITSLKPSSGSGASSGGGKYQKSSSKVDEGLTKQQLISKLIYKHYQAVKTVVDSGGEIKESVLFQYGDLKEAYNKKKKVLSEEHKRKIAEALKKAKKETNQFLAELAAKEHLDKIKDNDLGLSFSEAQQGVILEEQKKLAEMLVAKEIKEKEKWKAYDDSREVKAYDEKIKLDKRATDLSRELAIDEVFIGKQQNIVNAVSNGGGLTTLKDKVGVEYKDAPDFTKVNAEDISFSIDDILTREKPIYIPSINEKDFQRGGYIFDTIRIDKDTYILATNKHEEQSKVYRDYAVTHDGGYDPEQGGYVIVTLDQLVLTQDYYLTKKKAQMKQDADDRNQKQLDYWNKKTDDQKKYWMDKKGMYHSIPAKIKKKYTQTQYEALSLQEREKIYVPIKKYGVKRIKTKYDDHSMANSFHSMYERFVDPDAKRITQKTRVPVERGKFVGKTFAHDDAWGSWQSFRQMLDWKINDINIQREEINANRSAAIETSFGNINTNDSLYKELGVLVKRQNGDQINEQEIGELKDAWIGVQKTFGTLKENAKKDNLKLSHTGEKHIFASKAIGVYVPRMKTIGVTAKLGIGQLGFTMGHETAHWIDDTLGSRVGKRHISDNYESTAGQIAIMFRSRMIEKSNSKYINSTHECFARALEQYHATETMGDTAARLGKDKYSETGTYVTKLTYENKIKPLVEKFLEENREFLKSINIDIGELFAEEELEKGKVLPLGTIQTHSDGKKYKKVSNSGGPKDWQLVSKDKNTKQETSKDKKGADGQSIKVSKEELPEHAKNASESSLEGAIKGSSDPEVREAAHQEIDRREKEEKVQEEDGDKKVKVEQSTKGKDTIESLQAKIKELRAEDIDYSDMKSLEENMKQIQETQDKIKKIKNPEQAELDKEKIKDKKLADKKKVDKSEIKIKETSGSFTVNISKVGRIVGRISNGEYIISSTFIEEKERGKGYGKKLYKGLVDKLTEKGIKKIKSDIQVEEAAGRMYDFLKKEGYDVIKNKGAVLEKEDVGNYWWVPPDAKESPFEINLKKEEKKKDEK